MKYYNMCKLTGTVAEPGDGHFVMEAERLIKRRGAKKSEVFKSFVPVLGDAPKHKRFTIKGRLTQVETPDGVKTMVEPLKIEKATKDEYENIALLIGKFGRWTMNRSKKNVTPFGIQLLRFGTKTFQAKLFDNERFRAMSNWDNELKIEEATTPDSIIKMRGHLDWQKDIDNAIPSLVANEAKVIYAAPDELMAMQDELDEAELKKDLGIPDSQDLAADPIA